jgi:hypothetical protein
VLFITLLLKLNGVSLVLEAVELKRGREVSEDYPVAGAGGTEVGFLIQT